MAEILLSEGKIKGYCMKFIGIDGGGTKTRFTLFNEELKEIDSYVLPTCHFAQVGYEEMGARLQQGIHQLIHNHKVKEYGIGFGLAGYGQEAETRKQIEQVVARVSSNHPYQLVNDVESAIAGALALQDGIMMIAGTGSIAFGVRGETRMRCGGWGYQIGDEGSAYWLGKQVLALYSKQVDGRLERSVLYDMVKEACHLQQEADIISYVRDTLKFDRSKIAALARIAYDAAMQQDLQALALYETAAKELALCIQTIERQMFHGEDVNVSFVGGVFQAGELLLTPLQRELSTNCHLIEPIYGPDAGACLLLKQKLS